MVMDLGTTTIVAGQGDFSAYNYGNNGANWPAPSPAQVGYISKGQRDVAYVNGDWENLYSHSGRSGLTGEPLSMAIQAFLFQIMSLFGIF